MSSQLSDFNAVAQSGQELSRESLWPAEIKMAGSNTVIACSGGSVRNDDSTLDLGGPVVPFEVGFRVLKSALSNVLPEVGTNLSWRVAGAVAWRGPVRVDRAYDPNDGTTFILQGGNREK